MFSYSLAFLLFAMLNYSYVVHMIRNVDAENPEDAIIKLMTSSDGLNKLRTIQTCAYGIIFGFLGSISLFIIGILQ